MESRTGWLWISVGPKHRGNGYGEEALRLILDFAFDECNLHRVQLTVFAYNVLLSRCTRNLDFNGKDVTANSCIVMVVATALRDVTQRVGERQKEPPLISSWNFTKNDQRERKGVKKGYFLLVSTENRACLQNVES